MPSPDRLARIRLLARRFLLLTLVLIGILCGLVAAAFHIFVNFARDMMIGRALATHGIVHVVAVIATPAVVFALIALAINRFAPRAVGANLARVRMAYNNDPALLGPRAVAATFIANPLSLGAGAPLGPEGPITVVASGVSVAVARALKLPRKIVRGMIPVGVAAGIAAIFNTPITGVVFALEEVFGSADRGLLGGALVGSVAAAVVERTLLGQASILAAPATMFGDPRELVGFALVGVIAGLVSGYAIALQHRLKRIWIRLLPNSVARASVAGVMIGALGLLDPSILSVGYDSVSLWLHGGGTTTSTAIAFGLKTVAFVIAVSAGVLGGTFAPSLFMGAALGASIGHIAHHSIHTADSRALAMVGMGAFFAGLLRSPIAAVLIVVELTRDYDLIIPLMLGVPLAVAVSRRISRLSMVEQQMVDEGWVEGMVASDPLAHVTVADAMSTNIVTMRADVTLLDAVRAAAGTRHRIYPVVNDAGKLEGIVRRDAIEQAAREGAMEQHVVDLVEQPRLVAIAREEIVEVVRRMQIEGVDRCVVVDDARRVVGFLSPGDILRARMRRLPASEEEAAFDLIT